ncbi:MAG: pyridoxal phosphate-dependent aminotransferase [Chloroflexota bacterium]|jgi:aspartate aminotransferase|nr:pyridoxal phosphate-dependent aminotransferase [Chloroflexota bacterium]MDP6508317.1 pyridoxal phosphate-dependent aminotransferase [Chloroflexota bacterium]MDP6757834.1 pyridoxal phosphate-dependent aminotransferase [Chloroflexota bacterium]
MKLSDRVLNLAESATMAVSGRAAQLRREGKDIVSFGAGEPDFDTPDHIKQAAIDALQGGATKYATPSSGIIPLKEAVAAKLSRENSLDYDPSQVIVSVGGKEALYLAFATLLDEGDEVIIPAPYWVSYPEQAALCGGVPVYILGDVSNSFKITPAQLESAITPRTKAFVFNSPSNPGGFLYTPAEVDALAAVLEGKDIAVFSDEMYDRIIFGDETFKSYATASAHAYDHTITFNAGSKTYAMTGWRVGYAAGPADIIKGMAKIQTQTTSGTFTFGQHGLVAALNGDQACVEEMRQEFQVRANHIHARLNALDGVTCPRPSGSFYAFPDVSGTFAKLGVSGSIEFAQRLLEDSHVAVVPGEAFGVDSGVRLSFATSMEMIDKGLDRLESFLA